MEELSDSEVLVIAYLKSHQGQAVPKSHISKNVENAEAALSSLLERQLVENDEEGRYQLVPQKQAGKPQKFISPEILEILRKANIRPR